MPHALRTPHRIIGWLLSAAVCLAAGVADAPARADDSCGWVPTFGGASEGTAGAADVMVTFQGDTYLVGGFNRVGGVPVGGIARWDGTAWVAVPSSPFLKCTDATVMDDGTGPALYCAGTVSSGTGTKWMVQRWDGARWSSVGGLFNNAIAVLAAMDVGAGPRLHCGGPANSTADGTALGCVGAWNGSQWQPVGDALTADNGNSAAVYALASFDNGTGPALYVGGMLSWNSSGQSLGNVARLENGQWQPVAGGVHSPSVPVYPVYALLSVPDDDSGQPSLYVGGSFETAGGQPARGLARLDSTGWHPVELPGAGPGCSVRGLVRLAAHAGAPERLYAAGNLNPATGSFLAYREGARWHRHAGAFPPSSLSAAYSVGTVPMGDGGTQLVCFGGFDRIDGYGMSGLSYWDGAAWKANGPGPGLNGPIHAAVIFDDGQGGGPALYVGGAATGGLGVSFGGVAKWTGSTWQAVGAGLNGEVLALAVVDHGDGARLVAGGTFTIPGNAEPLCVASWDGTQWSPMSAGITFNGGGVHAFAVFKDGLHGAHDTLYAMGAFSSPPGLARFEGKEWRAVGNAVGTNLRCGTVWNDGAGDALWVGGASIKVNGASLGPIARFDGTAWTGTPDGMTGTVRAMTVLREPGAANGALVVGGVVNTGTISRVATWNGVAWRSLNDQFNNECRALTTVFDPSVGQDVLVAGGAFTTNGGAPLHGVAAWNGYAWWALGTGVQGSYNATSGGVSALLGAPAGTVEPGATGQTLLVGGSFFTSGGGDGAGHGDGGLARWNMCSVEADLNGDGTVSGADLGMLLGSWGPCDGCAADLNQDGLVNGSDLGLLLGVWTG